MKLIEARRAYKHQRSYFCVVSLYQSKGLGPVQEQQRCDRHYLSAAGFLCCEVQVEAQRRWSFALIKVAILKKKLPTHGFRLQLCRCWSPQAERSAAVTKRCFSSFQHMTDNKTADKDFSVHIPAHHLLGQKLCDIVPQEPGAHKPVDSNKYSRNLTAVAILN